MIGKNIFQAFLHKWRSESCSNRNELGYFPIQKCIFW